MKQTRYFNLLYGNNVKQTGVLEKILTRKLIDVNTGQWETTLNTVTSAQNVLSSRTWQRLHAVIHAVLYEPLIGWFKYKIKFPYFIFSVVNN